MTTADDTPIRYHEQTKHHFHRYARSLGYMDWATQPNPFRRYAGASLIELPFREDSPKPSYDELFIGEGVEHQAFNLETIAPLFELSMSLSAWKAYQGSRWSLRMNPSSGNLHPTESYLVAGPLSGLARTGGVYHYAPKEHALERRAAFDCAAWNKLFPLPNDQEFEWILVGLSSVFWREAWKYGERAYRYCLEDAGHALAAIAFSAAVNGWTAMVLNGVTDEQMATLLGLNRADDFSDAEREHPELLLAVGPSRAVQVLRNLALSPKALQAVAADATWRGRANRLSTQRLHWAVIDQVAEACTKSEPFVSDETATSPFSWDWASVGASHSASSIVRQRRSAVAFDGKTELPAAHFYSSLMRIMPHGSPPLAALGFPACIHLGLFVHRITDLKPGLYCLPRTAQGDAELRKAMDPAFAWRKPAGSPSLLPLFLLQEADVTTLATQVSCGQEIAGDSAFSLGFLAEFAPRLEQYGNWFYRRLHWEAGAIAQVLYLEAEAAGLRGTGMGCFFDDAVHEVFGLRGHRFQSLYHFTMGGAVEDHRLTSEAPYPAEMVKSRRSKTAATGHEQSHG